MEQSKFYKERIDRLQSHLIKLKQKKSAFGWLRFGSIAGIIAVFYLLWSFGIWYVIIVSILLLAVFIRLLIADLKNKTAIIHTTHLININKDELKYLEGNFYDFPDGSYHDEATHSYANDLDIFGKASLFQYINRATSEMGSTQLADYLKSAAEPDDILQRQTAGIELSKNIEWIQDLQAKGRELQITFSTKNRLQNWIAELPVFSKFKPWKWLRYLLPIIILSIVTLYIFDVVSSGVFYLSLFLFTAIAYQINKIVAPIHERLSKTASELEILSQILSHIESAAFESALLKELQSTLYHKNNSVSRDITKLRKLLDKLDLRYNLVLSAPLNILLLWNLQQMLDLEKWKLDQQKNINIWFETLGHIEALNSFAILHFNEPDWVFPNLISDNFFIEAKEIGHPLISKNIRVNNSVKINDNEEIMLVTGSNMAGKSTYLRSIGVNVVLAMAGAPVCAKDFKVTHVQLISSMRITDNLAESTSTFYAELKKLKTIIEKVNKGEKVFILLDEILRGTNSLDRHTGSVALIKQLIKHKASAIIATHDLELAKLKDDYPKNIINYHFDVQVNNDELFFDYLLKPGVCTSLNASILMKKIGIEL
ncbi:MAG TPA: MutS family DNA mismatch repair protein [Chitinophagaceae bacterium]|nr:MutS family DNA mismatch repair protein [Chitinophagaceae bacterium]